MLKEMAEAQGSRKMTFLRRGAWTPEEDQKVIAYITRYGIWNWSEVPKPAGLSRSGKSCRLRWMNYLRPGIKHGNFTREEEETILKLHEKLGNRWSAIAAKLPGRTDNEIKNYWNTRLKKRLKNSSLTPFGSQTISKLQASRKDSSDAGVLLPKGSNSEACSVVPVSYQLSVDNFSSSSFNPVAQMDKNQTEEKRSTGAAEVDGEVLQAIEEDQSFPFESLYDVEDFYGLSYADPVYPCDSYDPGNDFWINFLMETNTDYGIL